MTINLDETTAALRRVLVYLVDLTDGYTPETGVTTPTIEISKNGAAQGAGAGSWTEIGDGQYYYALTAGEVDTEGFLALRIVKAGVSREFSKEVEIVRAVATAAVVEDVAFGDAVWIDTTYGSAGTAFPLGTPIAPVDNLADALTIAAARGLRHFELAGSITLIAPLTNWTICGVAANNSVALLNLGGQNVAGSEFRNLALTGNSSGFFTGSEIEFFGTSDGVQGFFRDCSFVGTLKPAANAGLWLVDCQSGVADSGPPFIDLTNHTTGGSLNLRCYSGGLTVRNCDVGAFESTWEFCAGQIVLESTLTAGEFIVRGIVTITDNSAGATIDIDTALARSPIADAVWDEALSGHQTPGTAGDLATLAGYAGAVWIDTINGAAGTTIGTHGTKSNPVDSLADAVTLATALDLRHVKILGDSAIAITSDLEDYLIEGETSGLYIRPVVQIVSGSVARTTFRGVTLAGDLADTGGGVVVLTERCILTGLTGIECGIVDRESTFSATADIELEQNGALFSYGGHGIVSIVCNDTGATIELQRWDGQATIELTTGCTCNVFHRAPTPIVLSGDGGTANLYGPSVVDDQTTSTTVNIYPRDLLQHSLREAYVLDGGPGSADVTLDSRGLLLSGRVRVFTTPAKATAATPGAANGADGEIWAFDVTGTNTGVSGMLANLKMIGQ